MPATTLFHLDSQQLESWSITIILPLIAVVAGCAVWVSYSYAPDKRGRVLLGARIALIGIFVVSVGLTLYVPFANVGTYNKALDRFSVEVFDEYGITLSHDQSAALYQSRGQFVNGQTVTALVPVADGTELEPREVSLVPRGESNFELMMEKEDRLVPLTTSSG